MICVLKMKLLYSDVSYCHTNAVKKKSKIGPFTALSHPLEIHPLSERTEKRMSFCRCPRSSSNKRQISFFLVIVVFFLSLHSSFAQEFEDKEKLMDELDRLKTFTETRIKNKETVLQAKKDAWDREEKLDKSLDGLELEDKLERQFEADLEQVKELGGVVGGSGNRRMLSYKEAEKKLSFLL